MTDQVSDSPEARALIPCYVGVSPASCGLWVAAMVDDPESRERDKKHRVAFVASLVRRGLTVTRATVAEVRENLNWCDVCCPPTKAALKRRAAKAQEVLV